ncbi:MAG TPA: response regulator transcription factor [Ktedonobacterales bacterium]
MKLLVADSDADQMAMEVGWLRTRGYEVKFALSPDRIRSLWVEHHPDLAIVEPTLVGTDILGLCRDLRLTHDALVLAVSSEQDANTQIRCLESGADAFLAKPFLPAMLLAHIHALSRRVRNTLLRHPSSILTAGPIRVDSLRHELSIQGKVKRLTPTESKMLYLLAANANNVCTLGQIVAHVWGYADRADTMLVKAHVRHLREKIEIDPSNPRHIITIPGSGYMLVPHVDQQIPEPEPLALSESSQMIAALDVDHDMPQVLRQRADGEDVVSIAEINVVRRLPNRDTDTDYGARIFAGQ